MNTRFITGASRGLGLAFAEKALEQGDQLVLAARSLEVMKAAGARFPDTALAIEMDITDQEQRTTASHLRAARVVPDGH
ncbi:MAG: SDR family NAD(P)-dependent oxidoreductase [Caulobacter sp.]|nr:SDR family NAD(P)-dependent oxidoreductase [Caulobacter sp.]